MTSSPSSRESVQTQDSPTPVTSSTTPADKPTSKEGKRLMEQERNAVENARDGYRNKPIDVPPAGEETFDESSRGGTEPTHAPGTDADRRS